MAIPVGTSTPKPKITTGSGGNPSGMSSGATYYVQPPFDPRIYHTQFPLLGLTTGGKLQRGFMQWEKPIVGYSQKAKVKFLFNPSTMSAAYTMATGGTQTATLMYRSAHDKADPRFPMAQSISFALLYDRTYELWGAYNADGTPANSAGSTAEINNPHANGVNVDILAMKQFTGMLANLPAGVGNSKNFAEHQQGAMLFVPVWVYLGLADGLDYFGFITDWEVQITHWTQYMVPMRCVINVDMTLLPSPPAGSTGKDFGTTPWTSTKPGSGGTPPDIRIVSGTSTGRAGR
jgi:hypothetical protein